MASAKDSAEYQRPPSHWPFPTIGRNAFLLFGLFLLAVTLIPFWGSIIVAGIFALGLTNPVSKLAKKLGKRRRLASALVVGSLSILLLFPATFLSLRLYQVIAGGQAATQSSDSSNSSKSETPPEAQKSGPFTGETATKFSEALNKAQTWAVKTSVGAKLFEDSGEAREAIKTNATNLAKQVLAAVSVAMMNLPTLFLEMLVFGLFLYVFLTYPVQIRRSAFKLNLFRPNDLKRTIKILKVSSYNSLISNFFVGLIQASIITLGARFVGFTESILIFSVVFAISYIPFIGSAPVGYLLALLSFLTDSATSGFIMIGVATFAGVIDNLIRPYLVSNGETEVHPVLSFASILGALGVFGLKGLFLGPVILTSTIALLGHMNARKNVAAQKKTDQKKTEGGGVIHRLRAKPKPRRANVSH